MFGHGRQKHPRRRAEDDGTTTLGLLRPGDHAVISEIPDATARAQATRFGMGVGASVRCMSVIPGGPVVLRSGRQEIAVGRGLANRIGIEPGEGVLGEHAQLS